MAIEQKLHGLTGELGRDGILTSEQEALLNRIQTNAAERIMKSLAERNEGDLFPMVAMATGIGKGRIIHQVIEKQMKLKPDSKVLVIAGTKVELVRQTHSALAEHQRRGQTITIEEYIESEDIDNPEEVSFDDSDSNGTASLLYKTGSYGTSDSNVHVATIQTLQSEHKKGTLKPEDYDLVIVDEVHNVGTQLRKDILQQFENVVGFTATPYRNSGKMKSPEQYGFNIVDQLTLPEAQDKHLLPPLCGVQIDTKGLVDEIPMTSSGQIDFKELEKILKNSPDLRPYIADRVARIISSEGRHYKTVIAVNFVWEAQELAKLLSERGIKVGVAVNKKASKEIHTDQIPAIDSIERYKLPAEDERSIQVLISPYVASEGFDAPFTEVLVWASPTDSPLRYTQYTGRLARRADGKLFGVVVDCLYQTSQYNWSYNFGMWMKGNVKQLDNGLLWLGPEVDIDTLKNLPAIQDLQKQAEVKSLDNLQNEGILEVQDTDFSIIESNLQIIFIGSGTKLKSFAQEVIDLLENENKELIVKRKSGTHTVQVVTNLQRFIDEMLKRGVSLRDDSITEIQATDFPITQDILKATFSGSYAKVKELAGEILYMLEQEDSNLIVLRKSGSGIIKVVTDPQRFIDEMLKRGAILKDETLVDFQENDFPVTSVHINNTFFGDYRKLKPIADEVVRLLENESSSLIARRRSGNLTITVVTDPQRFIDEMLKRGVQLQDRSLLEIQDTDFPITQNILKATFSGSYAKVKELADVVLNLLREENLTFIKNRKNGSRIITVITDRQRFIDEMLKRGAKLRN